ncbi:MAG: type ISP restriction/modification enzyme [Candidatus Cloacimonadaceae bacterium]|nr:type ISP restriction/modification enzyme [Candidatus Cloacimonadaceae bacterium]
MAEAIFKQYLANLQVTLNQGDAREESFYEHIKTLLLQYAEITDKKKPDITILPKATEAGNPDFRVWDGKNHITGYIEAKAPSVFHLDQIETSEQLKRYLKVFPNLILTNFYEFRLYQRGLWICSAMIGRASNAIALHKTPPLEQAEQFSYLLERYFAFSLPAIDNPKSLAKELAKRTRFLRDEIIAIELAEEERQGKKVLLGFYDSFKRLLINKLTHEQFADLYAQTLTYGIFAARTKSEGEFNRELIYKYIPNTLGVLKSIFKFISYDEPPKALEVLIDDIAEILCVTDIKKILHAYYKEGKGSDPIIHFYETFLSEYDPTLREKRGVYYTPEPVVRYIVKSIHSILKSHFQLKDGLADSAVTLLDPAAGTLTFPAEAIKLAVQEYSGKYGSGSIKQMIRNHILPHFYALELMMAPYTVGHLKISYLLDELGYQMTEDERFKLYLTNTLEKDIPLQSELSFAQEITEECILANKVKQDEPVLVILGNPPYSVNSENNNEWTEQLLKQDIDGATSYYKVDGMPLREANPKMLQDDYVKFIRFAQWKIQKAGKGIVGMVTNHGYIDNATFKGMRQSLLSTFDQIYVLDLHGNSTKKETAPDGSKDENVFDIRTGVAILLMIKDSSAEKRFYHGDLYGLRSDKYDCLRDNSIDSFEFTQIHPREPFYLFKQLSDTNNHYLKWIKASEIFTKASSGIQTGRDNLTVHFDKQKLMNTISHFSKLDVETARIVYKLGADATEWKIGWAQKDLIDSKLNPDNIKTLLYRPFDSRYTYYTGRIRGFHRRPVKDVMKHIINGSLGLILGRQGQVVGSNDLWNLAFISSMIIDYNVYYRGGCVILPLYQYPDSHSDDLFASQETQANIKPELLAEFTKQGISAETIFYYIYGILYSNVYRERYSEYLKIDFPRIPFTKDTQLFKQMAVYGKAIADLHLMQSSELDTPIAKYQGNRDNDRVEQVVYNEAQGRIYINQNKYFEGISPEVWNYHIGGYQVLHKYLKDRKGRTMDNPIYFCRMITAISKTIEIQAQIDEIYDEVEKDLLGA